MTALAISLWSWVVKQADLLGAVAVGAAVASPVIVLLAMLAINRNRCELELEYNQLHVTDTPWIVSVRSYVCGDITGPADDLAAINSDSKEVIILAKGEDLTDATYAMEENGSVTISIPNTSDIKIIAYSFRDKKVSFRYLPYDDIEERKAYYTWTQDKRNDVNRLWFCEHIMPKMSLSNQKMNDNAIAYSLYGPHGSRTSYCHPS